MTRVVVGLLFDDHGKILIAKRNKHQMYGNLWEFPGGKIEKEETVEEALRREMYEELGAPITITRVYPGYVFRNGPLQAEFIPIVGSISPRDIQLNEHEACSFVQISEIDEFPFAPFDAEAINLLKTLPALH